MKALTVTALLVLISTTIFAQDSLYSSGLFPFNKYTLPETFYRKFSVGTEFSLSSNKYEHSNPDIIFNSILVNEKKYQFTAAPSFSIFKQTDDMNFYLNTIFEGIYSGSESESDINLSDQSGKEKNKNYRPSIRFSNNVGYDFYPNSGNYFFSFNSTANIQFNEMKNEKEYFSQKSSNYNSILFQDYRLGIGIGGGRLRDVTPIITALQFQQRLKMLDRLNNNLSDDTILKLAQAFSSYDDQVSIFDRPRKHFWKGIDNVLSQSGIDLRNMNFYALELLQESVIIPTFMRLEGFKYGINLGFQHINNFNKSSWSSPNDISYTTSYRYEYNNALINLYANYSTQLSLYSQFGFDAGILETVQIASNPFEKQRYDFTLKAKYDYELSDKFVASISNLISYRIINADKQHKDFINTTKLALYYFIEDRITLNFAYDLQYYDLSPYQFTAKDDFSHNIWFGCKYYFDKAFLF